MSNATLLFNAPDRKQERLLVFEFLLKRGQLFLAGVCLREVKPGLFQGLLSAPLYLVALMLFSPRVLGSLAV